MPGSIIQPVGVASKPSNSAIGRRGRSGSQASPTPSPSAFGLVGVRRRGAVVADVADAVGVLVVLVGVRDCRGSCRVMSGTPSPSRSPGGPAIDRASPRASIRGVGARCCALARVRSPASTRGRSGTRRRAARRTGRRRRAVAAGEQADDGQRTRRLYRYARSGRRAIARTSGSGSAESRSTMAVPRCGPAHPRRARDGAADLRIGDRARGDRGRCHRRRAGTRHSSACAIATRRSGSSLSAHVDARCVASSGDWSPSACASWRPSIAPHRSDRGARDRSGCRRRARQLGRRRSRPPARRSGQGEHGEKSPQGNPVHGLAQRGHRGPTRQDSWKRPKHSC